jgi:DNA-binding NtrC family response regulator
MTTTLLIIDDDLDDCQILEESLCQVGVTDPIEYKHAIDAGLRFLEEHKNVLPKIVIIDVNLPWVDGLTGLKVILEKYPVTAIMYTSSCTSEVKEKAIALGALDCVQKGSTYADNLRFAKRVFDLLHGHEVRSNPAKIG